MNRRSNRLGIYADVRDVADLALLHGGGSFECETIGMARNFSHRFYRFRKLYGEVYHADGSPNKYDVLICPAIKDNTVHFRIRQPIGTFRPAAAPAFDVGLADDEELFNIAQEVARKLQGE